MAEFWAYWKENFALSFTSWAQGQKVASLIGLLAAAGIGLIGAELTTAQSAVQHYWPTALLIAFLSVTFVITPFRMWQVERKKAFDAAQRLVPMLKCSFDKTKGCQHETKIKWRDKQTGTAVAQLKIRLFRVRIEAHKPGGIRECRANLLWLKRDNRVLFDSDALPLTIAPAERPDPFFKDLQDKVPEYADLFCLADGNAVSIYPLNRPYPISIHPDTLFSGPGEYRFHVVVSSPDSASAEIDVILKWTGDWQTAEAYAA